MRLVIKVQSAKVATAGIIFPMAFRTGSAQGGRVQGVGFFLGDSDKTGVRVTWYRSEASAQQFGVLLVSKRGICNNGMSISYRRERFLTVGHSLLHQPT